MPDPLDLSRVSREALEALARDVLDNAEWGSSTVSRIRAEATSGPDAPRTPVLRPEFVALGEALGMSRARSEREMHLLAENQQLESRIAALTVELEQVSKSHTAVNAAWDAARAQLATERAAREQAEAARTAWLNSSDRHFARAEENERKWLSAEQDRQQALSEFKREQQERLAQTDRYRACYDAKVAAETALASARALLLQINECTSREDIRCVIRAWLTLHPAPVVAPSAYAIQEGWSDPEPEDTRAPVADPSNAGCDPCCGNQGDHERGCPATPVAAPCAGCTSARTAITEALRLYAGGHEHGDMLRAWLKEHPQIELGKTQAALATERAAREQAEEGWAEETVRAEFLSSRLSVLDTLQYVQSLCAKVLQVERERDTALEEKEHYRCESERFSKDLNQVMFDLERNKQLKLEAARDRDTALARVKELELWKERHKVDPAHVEALEARVKELEAECELKGQLASHSYWCSTQVK